MPTDNPREQALSDDPATAFLSVGQRIDFLEILRFIDSGGSGEVYLARDHHLGRDVAFKILVAPPEHAQQERDRSWAEARAAAGSAHPNIVTVHSVGTYENHPWFTMPFADVGDLRDALPVTPASPENPATPVRTNQALSYLGNIASALDHLHQQDPPLIHSDIKPGNILIYGGNLTQPYACLADFGLADSEYPDSSFQVSGTLGYLAPERFSGAPPSVAADQYAFACTAFEAITGERAFAVAVSPSVSAKSRINAYRNAHSQERRPLPSDINPELRNFDKVFNRALAIDPEKRFSSAGEFHDALVSAQSTVDRKKPNTRRRVLVASLAIAILGAAVIGVGTARQAFAAPESECPSQEVIDSVETADGNPQFLALGDAAPAPDAHWLPENCRLQVVRDGERRYDAGSLSDDKLSTLYVFRNPADPARRDEFVREVLSRGLPDDGMWVNPATETLGREPFDVQYITDYARYGTDDAFASACVSSSDRLDTLFVEVHKGFSEEIGAISRGEGISRMEKVCFASKNLTAAWLD